MARVLFGNTATNTQTINIWLVCCLGTLPPIRRQFIYGSCVVWEHCHQYADNLYMARVLFGNTATNTQTIYIWLVCCLGTLPPIRRQFIYGSCVVWEHCHQYADNLYMARVLFGNTATNTQTIYIWFVCCLGTLPPIRRQFIYGSCVVWEHCHQYADNLYMARVLFQSLITSDQIVQSIYVCNIFLF